MKNIILISLCFFFFSCSNRLTQQSNQAMIDKKSYTELNTQMIEPIVDGKDLSFIISAGSNSMKNKTGIIIDLKFKNLSDKTLKLLNMFEPAGVFLTINITTQNDRIIQVLRASKADFPFSQSFEYIDIPKGRTYEKRINLGEILKDNSVHLPPGQYKLAMTYHNQYGKSSIKGWFKSNLLDLQVRN